MSRRVGDGAPSSTMNREMLNIFAEAFGIREVEINGKPQWSVKLSPADGMSSERTAIFIPETKSWSLATISMPTESIVERPTSTMPDYTSYLPGLHEKDYFPRATSKYQAANWAELLPDTPHNNFFRNVEWSNTPLGPLSTWPMSLRLYLHAILFQTTAAIVVHWGPRQIAIYNESFVAILGSAHPRFMGSSFTDDWHNFRNPFEGLFHQLDVSGVGTDVNNYGLFVRQMGKFELIRCMRANIAL
jgi:hypothetical protein